MSSQKALTPSQLAHLQKMELFRILPGISYTQVNEAWDQAISEGDSNGSIYFRAKEILENKKPTHTTN